MNENIREGINIGAWHFINVFNGNYIYKLDIQ